MNARTYFGNPDSTYPSIPDITDGEISNDTLDIQSTDFTLLNTISFELHPSIEDYVEDYQLKNSGLFEKINDKNQYQLNVIDKIFTQYNVPVELKYMAIVESKLKNTALSRTGAVGVWQFMPSTAKRYGLKITASADDRKNLWKSSVAAAKYLKRLYEIFDDWLLVVAAYNGGPGTVLNAIKKSGSRNFWKLQYFLPKESRMHVKKFIATHYYFESTGSEVTVTKDELDLLYENALAASQSLEDEEETPDGENKCLQPKRIIAITHDEEDINIILKK